MRHGRTSPARQIGWLGLMVTLVIGVDARASTEANRSRALAALARLRAEAPELTTVWPASHARPAVIRGIALGRAGRTLEQRALALLDELRPLVLGDSPETAVLVGQRTTRGRRVLRFEQRHGGVPIFGRQITVAFDRAGRIRAIHSDAVPLGQAPTAHRPRITAARAVLAAYSGATGIDQTAAARRWLDPIRPRLVLLADGGPARLAYAVVLPFRFDPRGSFHLVAADDGRYLGRRPGVLFERHQRPAGVR